MKENYNFRPIKSGLERKKATNEVVPLTIDEHEGKEQKPMTLKDHWLTLRHSIQEKISPAEQTQEEQERTKLLSEIITPELMSEYKQILKEFGHKMKKSDEHPQRELIDINDEKNSESIENWIESLITEVQTRNETGFDENDIEELRAQCWLFFDSVGCVMNTKTFERDVVDFYKDKNIGELNEKEQNKQKAELIKDLQTCYTLDKAEATILVNLIDSSDDDENYSPRILVETIAQLWSEYKLGEKKGDMTKISLGYLMSKGAESFAPSLFQDIISGDKFNVAVFLEYFGLNKVSEVIDTKTDIELAKVMYEISQQINERISNSLFFQEFEFMHEKSLGEIYATLERGKASTERLLSDSISQFAPALSGVGMSLAFLTKINPALGAIGLVSLPVMYKVAKKQNEKIWPMYEKEKREGEKRGRKTF